MFEVNYVIDQVWLAHKEAGLQTWVEGHLWALGVLGALWLVRRVFLRVEAGIMRREPSRIQSAVTFSR